MTLSSDRSEIFHLLGCVIFSRHQDVWLSITVSVQQIVGDSSSNTARTIVFSAAHTLDSFRHHQVKRIPEIPFRRKQRPAEKQVPLCKETNTYRRHKSPYLPPQPTLILSSCQNFGAKFITYRIPHLYDPTGKKRHERMFSSHSSDGDGDEAETVHGDRELLI